MTCSVHASAALIIRRPSLVPPPQVLLQIVGEDWRSFDAVNVATALHQLGSCRGLQQHQVAGIVGSPEFATLKEQVGRPGCRLPCPAVHALYAERAVISRGAGQGQQPK